MFWVDGVDGVDRVDGVVRVDGVDVEGVGFGVDFWERVFWDGWLGHWDGWPKTWIRWQA